LPLLPPRQLGLLAGLEHGRTIPFSEYLKNDFLAKGRFLTVLPRFMLKVPGWHPQLKALPIALPNTRAPIGLITLKGRMLTPLAQLFIETVRAIAKPMVEST